MPLPRKHWLKSKTVWANVLAGIAASTALLAQQLPDFKEKIPTALYLGIGALLAALNVWLRFRTASAITPEAKQ